MGGSQNVISLLDELIKDADSKEKISSFITLCATQYFEISVSDLISESKSNSSCRTICYKLQKDFAKKSIRKTMVIYNRKENAVLLGLRRMEEVIESPQSDLSLYNDYLSIKNQVQKFIQYLVYEKEKGSAQK